MKVLEVIIVVESFVVVIGEFAVLEAVVFIVVGVVFAVDNGTEVEGDIFSVAGFVTEIVVKSSVSALDVLVIISGSTDVINLVVDFDGVAVNSVILVLSVDCIFVVGFGEDKRVDVTDENKSVVVLGEDTTAVVLGVEDIDDEITSADLVVKLSVVLAAAVTVVVESGTETLGVSNL